MNKKFEQRVLIILVTLTLVACAPSVASLSPEKGAAYAVKVDEIVENLVVGITENDYTKYTRDLDEGYLENYRASLQQTAAEISGEFGAYQGKTFDHVEGQLMRRTVVYHLVFENEPDVLLQVSFSIFDSHHIIGTYWNSK